MLIVLTGMRGSGKTAVGKLLAERLGYQFIDMDSEIEKTARKSIAEIFEKQGEPAFRKMESSLAAKLSKKDNCVIASGGGLVESENARETLLENACVFYLEAHPALLAKRLALDPATKKNRPRLTNAPGLLPELEQILAKRKPLYESTASYTIDASRTIAAVAREIEIIVRESK